MSDETRPEQDVVAAALVRAVNARIPPKDPTGDHGVFQVALEMSAGRRSLPDADPAALGWLEAQCRRLAPR